MSADNPFCSICHVQESDTDSDACEDCKPKLCTVCNYDEAVSEFQWDHAEPGDDPLKVCKACYNRLSARQERRRRDGQS